MCVWVLRWYMMLKRRGMQGRAPALPPKAEAPCAEQGLIMLGACAVLPLQPFPPLLSRASACWVHAQQSTWV